MQPDAIRPVAFRPTFAPGEFRITSPHFEIRVGGRRVLYAYIRKNASTAFKALVGRRLHPRYVLARLRGRTRAPRFAIDGNLRYFAARPEQLDVGRFDAVFFVYRDPLERFISVFLNKFVDYDRAAGMERDVAAATGRSIAQVSLRDVMAWVGGDFASVNAHLWPQKSHLWSIDYTHAIPLGSLRAEMGRIIGERAAQRWFSTRVNVSDARRPSLSAGANDTDLTDLSVHDLRALVAAGRRPTAADFATPEVRAFVADRYAADYALITQVGARP